MFQTPPLLDTLIPADLTNAPLNPAYVPKSQSTSPLSVPGKISLLQTLAVSADENITSPLSPTPKAAEGPRKQSFIAPDGSIYATVQKETSNRMSHQTSVEGKITSPLSPTVKAAPQFLTQTLVPPFPVRGASEDPSDQDHSQLSRQSSVDDGYGMDSKSKRKTSGGKSSAIKNKIQMRKMIKEANKMEIPSGVLSDPDNDVDNDSVEEKQDSESTHDSERSATNKKLSTNVQPVAMSQLTPETARKMKDWNSRFSNLKHSFDPNASEMDDNASRSPSMQRHNVGESSDGEDTRGRGRFRDRGSMAQRSKSAQAPRNSNGPTVVVEEYMQTKDDKNKNNTIIAKRASSHPEKDKSPSVRRVDHETDDEYTQYLCSVDRYRQNNPNPKPFRPITTRSDAIAAPLRKLSDQSGDDKLTFKTI